MLASHGRHSHFALERISRCFLSQAHGAATNVSSPKKRGRPRKSPAPVNDSPPVPHRAQKHSSTTTTHRDLLSFIAHASSNDLSTASTVYKGTYYEYLVAQTLGLYNFDLERVGQANDLGIDLLGSWRVPAPELNPNLIKEHRHAERALNVLVQCKATLPKPSMIRELEGAYAGAPAGWRTVGEGAATLGLLVCNGVATEGVREAVQRSQLPLGFLQLGYEDGIVRQFVWNTVARHTGLEGLGVTMSFGRVGGAQGVAALTWMGELWKSHREDDSHG